MCRLRLREPYCVVLCPNMLDCEIEKPSRRVCLVKSKAPIFSTRYAFSQRSNFNICETPLGAIQSSQLCCSLQAVSMYARHLTIRFHQNNTSSKYKSNSRSAATDRIGAVTVSGAEGASRSKEKLKENFEKRNGKTCIHASMRGKLSFPTPFGRWLLWHGSKQDTHHHRHWQYQQILPTVVPCPSPPQRESAQIKLAPCR